LALQTSRVGSTEQTYCADALQPEFKSFQQKEADSERQTRETIQRLAYWLT
jgi:hypothetical protein